MPDFLARRRLARMVDRTAALVAEVPVPDKGWIATVRLALGMTAEQVGRRKGVSRNAVYQAERSEKDGAVSINQMHNLAAAMGGTFVYAIVLDDRVDRLKYKNALKKAQALITHETGRCDVVC